MTLKIKTQRLYESLKGTEGFRVLVDRLWPRGVSKQEFEFDLWCKDLAPTSELRKWFDHEVEKWPEFCERYQAELRSSEQQHRITKLIEQAGNQKIVLLYGAKDAEHNQAIVLAREIKRRIV